MRTVLARLFLWWHCLWGMFGGHRGLTEVEGLLIARLLFIPRKTTLIACSCGRIFYQRSS